MSSVALALPLTSPVADSADRWRRRLLTAYVALLPVMVVRDVPWVGSKVQITELVFLALFVAWSLGLVCGTARLASPPVARWIAIWLAVGAVSSIFALRPRDSIVELAAWAYLAALCVVVATAIRTWGEWQRVIAVWVVASAFTATLVVVGVLCGMLWDLPTPFALRMENQSVIRRPFWIGVALMWAPATPNMVIGYLLSGSLLSLGLLWTTRERRTRWLAGAAVAIHVLAVGFTVSRVVIAVGFALIVFLLRFRSYGAELFRWALLIAWLVLTLTVQTVSYFQPAAVTVAVTDVEEPAAAAYRQEYYWHLRPDAPVYRLQIDAVYAPFARTLLSAAALDLWRERPWLGLGPGGFARELYERQKTRGERWRGLHVVHPWDAHSTYLGALAEIGVLGTLSVLVVFAVLMRQAVQALRWTSNLALSPLVWAIVAVLAGYVVAGFDDDMLTKRWFWCMAGLAGSAWLLARDPAADGPA